MEKVDHEKKQTSETIYQVKESDLIWGYERRYVMILMMAPFILIVLIQRPLSIILGFSVLAVGIPVLHFFGKRK